MDLYSKLLKYGNRYPEEKLIQEKMLSFLELHNNPFDRNLMIGHFTASAFLLNHNKTKFLLLHHNKLQKWLQPGGHCEDNNDLLFVAVKEAQEESGIKEIVSLSNEIFDIDIHYVPSNNNEVMHYHYDVRFLLKTVNNDNFMVNHEASEIKWFSLSSSIFDNLDDSVLKMINKYNKLYAK